MKNGLFLALLLCQQVFASALFDRTSANYWLFEANGAVSGFNYGSWLTQFDSSVYTLSQGTADVVLINEVPVSSTLMTSQLSPVSLHGLGETGRSSGDIGGDPIWLEPAAGFYGETIEVVMYVDTSLIETYNTLTLVWQVNGGEFSSRIFDGRSDSVEGFFEAHMFLVSNETHNVHVELLNSSHIAIASMDRSYTINSTKGDQRDTDTDGLPDLVELAIGLNPLKDDWQTDANNDGWSDFDQWLRSASSNKNEIPLDSDNDEWSDWDETRRGTDPFDTVVKLGTLDSTIPAPETGTQLYRDILLSFKEHPVAPRLYAVEYLVSASKPSDGLSWNSTTASYSLSGETLFDSSALLSQQQLAWADVAIANSLKQSNFESWLAVGQARFRVSASPGQVLDIAADEEVILNPGAVNEQLAYRRWHYRTLLPSLPDLIPARFIPVETWLTADDWKQLYIKYLELNLVVNQSPTLSLDESLFVEALQLLITTEIHYQGGIGNLSWDDMQSSHQQVIVELQDSLLSRENGRNLYDVFTDLRSMLQANGLTASYSWLQSLQSGVDGAVDVSRWLQQQAATSTDTAMQQFRYLGRFALFRDGLTTVIADPNFELSTKDLDLDGLSNADEVGQIFSRATYPWVADTDGDLIPDGVDDCPVGADQNCGTAPLLQISSSSIISEPDAGQAQNLLVSFQLDKVYQQDVSFRYVVTASGSDTATANVDFSEMNDSLIIHAGQQVVSIAVPVFADSDFSEGNESFHIELLDVVNAVVTGSVTTINITPAISSVSNADLSALTMSVGTLDQVFQSSLLNYTSTVSYIVTTATLTAIASDSNASLTVNGIGVNSGAASAEIDLSEGDNLIEVAVTAQDSSIQTYRLTLTRQSVTSFVQQAYVKASNTGAGDLFASAVAISGDTMAVGAFHESGDTNSAEGGYNDNETYAGAVYVFTRTTGVWTQQAYLKAPNAQLGDEFGDFIALDGDTLAIGAPGEDGDATSNPLAYNDNADGAGAVYVFTRSGGSWTQQAYIKADNAGSGDKFGENLALNGDTLVVGATGQDDGGSNAGAAYVFIRNGDLWSQQAILKASNVQANDIFGGSVAYDSESLAVGATSEGGDATSIEGAYNDNAPLAGAVYVFTRNAGVWAQQAYIKAGNAELVDSFGASVSLSGDTLAVGAYGEDGDSLSIQGAYNNNASGSGAVYVFTRNAGTWAQQAYVKAPNAEAGDQFGKTLALQLNTLVVSASLEDGDSTSSTGNYNNNALSAGAVYLFTRSGSSWTNLTYIKASNAEEGDRFGASLGLSGDTMAAGANEEDSAATGVGGDQSSVAAPESGATYIFQ